MHDANDKLNLLLSMGRYKDAERVAREAIAAEPERGGHYTHLARALINLSRPEEAEQAARSGVKYAPYDAWSHDILAFVLARQKKYTLALKASEEAARIDPSWIGGYRTRAWILNQLKRLKHHEQALKVTNEGLRFDATDWQLLKERGWAFYELERFPEAEEVAQSSLALHPDQVVFQNLLACVKMTRGDRAYLWNAKKYYAEAEKHFRECLRKDPTETAYSGNRRLNILRWARRYGSIGLFVLPLLFVPPCVLLMQALGAKDTIPIAAFPVLSIVSVIMLHESEAFTLMLPRWLGGSPVRLELKRTERIEGNAYLCIFAIWLIAGIVACIVMQL